MESAIVECGHFIAAGGRTIVDLTPRGAGDDPLGLRRIAEATGLNIIASSGYYIDAALPDWVRNSSVDELADRLVSDVQTGGVEGVRRGAIGEIAIEGPTELELRCVRAAGRAQARTGAPVFLHVMSGILPAYRESTEEVIDMYRREGGALSRLVLCHQDGSGDDPRVSGKYPETRHLDRIRHLRFRRGVRFRRILHSAADGFAAHSGACGAGARRFRAAAAHFPGCLLSSKQA